MTDRGVQQNVGQLLTKRAVRDPGAEAIFEPANGRRLSYSELNSGLNQVAHALIEGGVGLGDRVALL